MMEEEKGDKEDKSDDKVNTQVHWILPSTSTFPPFYRSMNSHPCPMRNIVANFYRRLG
jgi:hypothetical protein